MPEELRDLIEKIREEGVKAADDKAKTIEDAAQLRAGAIVKNAEGKAKEIIREAKERILKMEQASEASLKQVLRDILLGLRKEINAMLERVIVPHVRAALGPDEMAKLISALVKGREDREKSDMTISLRKEDLEKLEKALFANLADEMKKGIVLKPSEDIGGGFLISYDSGKSYYDYSDKALAEYIASYLKPKLAGLLIESKSRG